MVGCRRSYGPGFARAAVTRLHKATKIMPAFLDQICRPALAYLLKSSELVMYRRQFEWPVYKYGLKSRLGLQPRTRLGTEDTPRTLPFDDDSVMRGLWVF